MSSLGGSRCNIVFIDDKSRRILVYFLKSKPESDVLKVFKQFQVMAELQSGRKLKMLRTDNGKGYDDRGFETYLNQHGIRHQSTQNGMTGRANQSILDCTWCMLFEAGLLEIF